MEATPRFFWVFCGVVCLLIVGGGALVDLVLRRRERRSTAGNARVGQPPYRDCAVPPEPRPPFLPEWVRGVGRAVDRFFDRRDTQLAFRLPLVPMAIYLIYWGWTWLSGGEVSDGAFFALVQGDGEPLFVASRLLDVPSVFLFIAAGVAAISGVVGWFHRLDKMGHGPDSSERSAWWGISCAAMLFGALVVAVLFYVPNDVTNPDTVWLTAFRITLFFAAYGALWALVASFWSGKFWLKALCAVLTHALTALAVAVPIGFGEGWLTGLLTAFSWFAACSGCFLIVATVGHLLVLTVTAILESKPGPRAVRTLVSIGNWFIAASPKKAE